MYSFIFRRVDIEQASVAPLMASVIGVNYPVNSVGELPLELLGGDAEWKSSNMLSNAKQIYALSERHHGTFPYHTKYL